MRTTVRATRKTNSSKRQPSSRRIAKPTKRRSASVVSLENGIKIIKYALKHSTSLSAAAYLNGRGKNYISDIKARLEENFKNKNISKELYSSFKSLNKQYEKASK